MKSPERPCVSALTGAGRVEHRSTGQRKLLEKPGHASRTVWTYCNPPAFSGSTTTGLVPNSARLPDARERHAKTALSAGHTILPGESDTGKTKEGAANPAHDRSPDPSRMGFREASPVIGVPASKPERGQLTSLLYYAPCDREKQVKNGRNHRTIRMAMPWLAFPVFGYRAAAFTPREGWVTSASSGAGEPNHEKGNCYQTQDPAPRAPFTASADSRARRSPG